MKKQITPILTLIFFLLFNSLALAQQPGPQALAMLEDSPAGSQVLKFLKAVNDGKGQDETLVRSIFSEALIEKRGIGSLSGILQALHNNDAPLVLFEVYRKDKFEYQLKLFGNGNGKWLDATLFLEDNAPCKVKGFRIDISRQASASAEPVWPAAPFTRREFTLAGNEEIARQAKTIARAYHDMGWFSGVVLIAREGKPFYQEAFGYADIENKDTNTLATKFRIGSINKDYTAVLVLQMVEAGKLSLDDKLEKFQLRFPAGVAAKITIRQLLSHTSGFGDIFIPEYLDNIRAYKDIDDILPLLRDKPLAYEPGTGQEYSNYGYIVLGAILEKASGKSFENLLRENIFKPLGARNTHYQIAEQIEGEARSYRFKVSGEKADHTAQLEYPTPDGGMYSTAAEQLEFFQALFYTNKLINDESKALLLADYNPNPPSWEDIMSQDGSAQAFAGGGPGVSAVVLFLLKENVMAVVLANTDGNVAGNISRRLEQAIAGQAVKEPQLPLENYLYSALKEHGGQYLKQNLDALLAEGGYESRSPMTLNRLGYRLLDEAQAQGAIEVFRINTELYPNEANPWDSLAEACFRAGDKKMALQYYRKALEIDPELPSAKRMVEELE